MFDIDTIKNLDSDINNKESNIESIFMSYDDIINSNTNNTNILEENVNNSSTDELSTNNLLNDNNMIYLQNVMDKIQMQKKQENDELYSFANNMISSNTDITTMRNELKRHIKKNEKSKKQSKAIKRNNTTKRSKKSKTTKKSKNKKRSKIKY